MANSIRFESRRNLSHWDPSDSDLRFTHHYNLDFPTSQSVPAEIHHIPESSAEEKLPRRTWFKSLLQRPRSVEMSEPVRVVFGVPLETSVEYARVAIYKSD